MTFLISVTVFKINFFGAENVLGPKVSGAESVWGRKCLGPKVSGAESVGAESGGAESVGAEKTYTPNTLVPPYVFVNGIFDDIQWCAD